MSPASAPYPLPGACTLPSTQFCSCLLSSCLFRDRSCQLGNETVAAPEPGSAYTCHESLPPSHLSPNSACPMLLPFYQWKVHSSSQSWRLGHFLSSEPRYFSPGLLLQPLFPHAHPPCCRHQFVFLPLNPPFIL